MKNIIITLTAILALTLTACNKDKEAPVITVETPAEHTTFKWGEKVHLHAEFTDDRELKEYSATVVNESGEHLHEFDFMVSGEITTGKEYKFHEHFMVPTDAPMMAWVKFVVTDTENKTTELKWMLHFEE